ncbi:cytochrome c oxidase subunit 6a, partial [Lecanoromycetidae sp. Uapishka_2]
MLQRISTLRTSQIASRQLQSPVLRHTFQRRFASNEPTKLVGPMDNAFNRERLAVKQHAAASAGSLNAKNLWDEHWEHWEHMPPLEERVQYPYMNIRTKAYPWGDGDKTLFWNPKVNYHDKDA